MKIILNEHNNNKSHSYVNNKQVIVPDRDRLQFVSSEASKQSIIPSQWTVTEIHSAEKAQ
jgi:hypothetical protein